MFISSRQPERLLLLVIGLAIVGCGERSGSTSRTDNASWQSVDLAHRSEELTSDPDVTPRHGKRQQPARSTAGTATAPELFRASSPEHETQPLPRLPRRLGGEESEGAPQQVRDVQLSAMYASPRASHQRTIQRVQFESPETLAGYPNQVMPASPTLGIMQSMDDDVHAAEGNQDDQFVQLAMEYDEFLPSSPDSSPKRRLLDRGDPRSFFMQGGAPQLRDPGPPSEETADAQADPDASDRPLVPAEVDHLEGSETGGSANSDTAGDGGISRQPAHHTGQPSAPHPSRLPQPVPTEPVTLHFNEIDVRQALQMLSRKHGLNILLAPGVSGTLSANLDHVDEEQALTAILKLCNLVAHRENQMIYVYGANEFPLDNSDLQVFPLDYAASEDILDSVQGILSPSGNAYVTSSDPADNRRAQEVLVVVDTPSTLRRVAQFVAQMDQPPAQVMIEVHVLSVELGKDFRHGVNIRNIINIANKNVEIDIRGFADENATPGVVARLWGADMENLLETLKSTTDAKTLASPRVMALNEQKARIQIGEQLGYKIVTVTQTAAVEDVRFLQVGVVLEVTPRITRDGRILMRVKPKVSDGEINPNTLLPEEETTEVETDVLLENGQGVVIGGLIQERDVEIRNKVPILGHLRVIGPLFRRTILEKSRSEIIVTLVPRITHGHGNATPRDEFDAMRSATPLFCGPLERYPRPWEPKFPRHAKLRQAHCRGEHCHPRHCRCHCQMCMSENARVDGNQPSAKLTADTEPTSPQRPVDVPSPFTPSESAVIPASAEQDYRQ